MKQLYRTPLNQAISMALAGTAIAATVVAPVQAQSTLEEVTVTAQKRVENLQDVAVSIQVLGTEKLENLQIRGFEDYILFLPTVSYTSNGPGYGQVYMRGISSGGDGNHSASMPSVGVYLDEQPVTTINQILDVHIVLPHRRMLPSFSKRSELYSDADRRRQTMTVPQRKES